MANVPEIEITVKEYTKYKNARDILLNAFSIEEIYEIVIRSYIDFEKQLSDTSIIHMTRSGWDYRDIFEEKLVFNIRLLNLLTACRLYIDQVKPHVRECISNVPDSLTIIEKFFQKNMIVTKNIVSWKLYGTTLNIMDFLFIGPKEIADGHL